MLVNPDPKAKSVIHFSEDTTIPITVTLKNIESDRCLARDVNTAPEILRELATSRDRSILASLASHPNLPIDLLWELGAQFPDKLMQNPKFEKLVWENSVFLKQMPYKTAANLFFHRSTPDRLREILLNYYPALMDY
jgi:hypothetical protein